MATHRPTLLNPFGDARDLQILVHNLSHSDVVLSKRSDAASPLSSSLLRVDYNVYAARMEALQEHVLTAVDSIELIRETCPDESGRIHAVPVGLQFDPPLVMQTSDLFSRRESSAAAATAQPDGPVRITSYYVPIFAPIVARFIAAQSSPSSGGGSIRRVVFFISGNSVPGDSEHASGAGSTEATAILLSRFMRHVYPNVLCHHIASGDDVFRYDANVAFLRRYLIPHIDGLRRSLVDNFADDWARHFSITISLATGAPARLAALTASCRQYRPSFIHMANTKQFFYSGSIAASFTNLALLDFESVEAFPSVAIAELDEDHIALVHEMRKHVDCFLSSFQKGSSNELATFWLRKTRQPVLAVLAVKKHDGPTHFFRAINTEVSMPTGSLCAERAAIAMALALDPAIHRKDFRAIAVLSLPKLDHPDPRAAAAYEDCGVGSSKSFYLSAQAAGASAAAVPRRMLTSAPTPPLTSSVPQQPQPQPLPPAHFVTSVDPTTLGSVPRLSSSSTAAAGGGGGFKSPKPSGGTKRRRHDSEDSESGGPRSARGPDELMPPPPPPAHRRTTWSRGCSAEASSSSASAPTSAGSPAGASVHSSQQGAAGAAAAFSTSRAPLIRAVSSHASSSATAYPTQWSSNSTGGYALSSSSSLANASPVSASGGAGTPKGSGSSSSAEESTIPRVLFNFTAGAATAASTGTAAGAASFASADMQGAPCLSGAAAAALRPSAQSSSLDAGMFPLNPPPALVVSSSGLTGIKRSTSASSSGPLSPGGAHAQPQAPSSSFSFPSGKHRKEKEWGGSDSSSVSSFPLVGGGDGRRSSSVRSSSSAESDDDGASDWRHGSGSPLPLSVSCGNLLAPTASAADGAAAAASSSISAGAAAAVSLVRGGGCGDTAGGDATSESAISQSEEGSSSVLIPPPCEPCGACREWLLKIAAANPDFRVLSFGDVSLSHVFVKPVSI